MADDYGLQKSVLTDTFEGYAQDVRLNRWEYFTGVVEAFLLKAVKRYGVAWYKRGDESLIGHASMLYLISQNSYEPKCNHVIDCLMFIKEHDGNAFLHQNSALSTLVDIVLTQGDILSSLADFLEDSHIAT